VSSYESEDRRILEALRRIGVCLDITVDIAALNLGDVRVDDSEDRQSRLLVEGARQAGIFMTSRDDVTAKEVTSSLAERFPVVLAQEDGTYWVFERLVGGKVEASRITSKVELRLLSENALAAELRGEHQAWMCKRELECATLSAMDEHGSHDDHHHEHPKPLKRFIALLNLDRRDIWAIVVFATVAGVLGLATPLAIESLVNVVSWGTYFQPLLVLGLMLLACLGLAGVLKVLQTVVVEIIQRRQLVRIVGDLAHRFPRAQQSALAGLYPRELANRVFDIMTIQKASAVLLLDGTSIILTTIMGLLLLAFYHPFLLGFDIALLLCMLGFTWVLGRGGIGTAINESITKYKIAHWLQDVLSTPAAFKVNGGEMLAVERANRLTADYITARQKQFRVVIRQIAFAIGLQVVASTALLGLGGWLVMSQQLTLGQLVASELVVTVVVGAFAKAGKSLEKFYDLMAGIDKVGHLLDIPVDPRYEIGEIPAEPVEVHWEQLQFAFANTGSSCSVPAYTVEAGTTLAVIGGDRTGKSLLIRSLAGLIKPKNGMAQIGGFDAQRAALAGSGRLVGLANRGEIFHATIEENVDVGRGFIGNNRVREALVQVGLWDTVMRLPNGLQTMLQSNGSPLSSTQKAQLIIARAIAGGPSLLLIDSLLDDLTPEVRESLWQTLASKDAPWTLILVTNQRSIANLCDNKLELQGA
jgi:putative ABC transport system ATP-binding protein